MWLNATDKNAIIIFQDLPDLKNACYFHKTTLFLKVSSVPSHSISRFIQQNEQNRTEVWNNHGHAASST